MAERRGRHLPVRSVGPNRRYIVRDKSSAVLLALVVIALLPALVVAQYAPKWHAGDWWIVKTWWEHQSSLRGIVWEWRYMRYDVAGIEKVGQNDCYVVELRGDRQPNIRRDGTAGAFFYVRTNNWRAIRTREAVYSSGKRVQWDVRNYPLGLFGPFVAEPRLPRFPLQLTGRDTVFGRERRDEFYADLREISRPADSALVERLLAEGDTAGGQVVRPKGAVYEVRSELGGDLIPGSPTGDRDIVQSLQLWCDDLPWRLFEELVGYSGPNGTRSVTERSWLVAVGQSEK
jgi:hypothetical protein